MAGQHLRVERERRGWTRLTMAKKLREAADSPADVPCLEHLMANSLRTACQPRHKMLARMRKLATAGVAAAGMR